MAEITVHLFGSFEVQRGEDGLADLPGGKVQELLCYLLLHREQVQARETLASVLWPDCTTVKSKKYLRQALWQLQMTLDSVFEERKVNILTVDSGSICMDGRELVAVDVNMFEKACAQAKGLSGEQLDQADAEGLRQAVQLYRGDLLEGWYQDWCLYERERLQSCYLSILGKLMSYCQRLHDYHHGLEYGERILRLDRAYEYAHQQLMRLHYQSGNRTAALRQYARCKAALQEELDIQPSQLTQELYEQIRTDQAEIPSQLPTNFVPEDPRPPKTLGHLNNLLQFVNKVEIQIRKEIQAVKQSSQA
ncbi:MAG TPA: bacterial transcriptional activator domain-containing protein [Candidatus Angelobacter sp.]|jgi:DNA-binding SARP family transcriptional activator|nr:bacterial transcriptional activator domain-containing protein [Candidatus Angelobacter sp.]